MTILKYMRNSTLTDPWARAIGKFILNFGLLEFESHMWLLQMSDEPQLFPDESFSQRVKRISKLVDRQAFDATWRDSAERSWERARTLASTRNQLAHNPLLFSWTDSSEKGAPNLIGIPDIRELKNKEPAEPFRTSLADIARKTDQTAVLIERLAALRDVWCSVRNHGLSG